MPSTNLSVGIGTLTIDGSSVGWLKGDVTYTFQYETSDLTVGRPLRIVARAISQPRASLKATLAEINLAGAGLVIPAGTTLQPQHVVVYETKALANHSRIKIEFPSAVITTGSIRTAETGYSVAEMSIDAVGDMPLITITRINADGTDGASTVLGGSPPVTYGVTYNPGGGSGAPTDPAAYEAGDGVTVLFSPAPTQSGKNFLGWATTASASSPVYTQSGTTSFSMPANNVTLYAVFTVLSTYNVTYNSNGGSMVPVDSQEYLEGALVSVKFNVIPIKTGYNFLGWSPSPSDSSPPYTQSGMNTFSMPASDVTLYAIYQSSATYNVTYDANNGPESDVVPTDSVNYGVGQFVSIKFDVTPTYSGHTFVGWDTNPSASSPSYTQPPSGVVGFPMPSNNVTLYAIYTTP